MAYLNDKINQLEKEIAILKDKINSLSEKTEKTRKPPESKIGMLELSKNRPMPSTGRVGRIHGGQGNIIWNDGDLSNPPWGTEPNTPTKAYNEHGHSRFSGGALPIDVVEFVEYDWGELTNKHCAAFWYEDPTIAKVKNSSNEEVEKIGVLDLVFNADTGKWGVTTYEINVEHTYLVKRKADGTIETDENGVEKKSVLYNADSTKSAVVWDSTGQVWRFHATYAE